MPTINSLEAVPQGLGPQKQALKQSLANLTEQEFCEAFEALQIPKESFHHREHIRLAWIYSSHYGEDEAAARMAQGIRAFARHHGVEQKYHHTITLAWMRLVLQAVRTTPQTRHFASFVNANPHLLNPRLLGDYYSPELLKQDAARSSWIEPDLRPLSGAACSCDHGAREG
jgi:hypothetical protein